MDTFQELGRRIRRRRKELGITQVEFAMSLNLSEDSRAMISKWENGLALPTTALIPDICKILCCDVGYLFGEYELPTRELSDISAETGLSVEAINELRSTKESPIFHGFLPALSWLMTNGLLDVEIPAAIIQLKTDAVGLARCEAECIWNSEYSTFKDDSDLMKFKADSAFRRLLDEYFEYCVNPNNVKPKVEWRVVEDGID